MGSARICLFAGALLLGLAGSVRADDPPKVVPVGGGSYASYPPDPPNAETKAFLTRALNIDPSMANEPVPTNKWWTNLLFNKYPGNLWAYPLTVNADEQGVEIFSPSQWNDSGGDMLLGDPLRIGGTLEHAVSKVEVIADFESPTYPDGWSTSGTAWGNGPAQGSLPGQTAVSGYLGKYLATSIHGDDRATGQLVSPLFTVDKKSIHFLLGGGHDPDKLHIDLVVNDKVVCTQTGENNEELHWHSWDTSQFIGQQARIRVTDMATGGWGHISVDEILQTDETADPPPFSPGSFSPTSTRAMSWGDWTVKFRLAQADDEYMDVTIGRGSPFAWLDYHGLTPKLPNINTVLAITGEPATLPLTADAVIVENGGHEYGLYAPPGTKFSTDGRDLALGFAGAPHYLVVAQLPDKTQGAFFGKYARARPRDSKFTWNYDPAKGKVTTKFDLDLESLDGTTTDTLQGWLPHHYRATENDLKLCDYIYPTPRGKLKLAPGHSFSIAYPFAGMLPALPAPSAAEVQMPHGFVATRMSGYLSGYAQEHCTKVGADRYGEDTYWGGKDLGCYAQYTAMAHELNDPTYDTFLKTLDDAMADWMTYTPGEKAHYFARYDRWKALVGYHGSYGSEMFTDNHFHYGYFTFSGALLAMYDPNFLPKYGEMMKLMAKQYANWDRSDKNFPYLRTFDPWVGHSYAGGESSGNGNNQESSSEAMQSWGGVFLLGSMLQDKEMTAAGAMGYVVESEAVREYWNNYYGWKQGPDASNWSPKYKHTIVGIMGDSGQAFGTFFEGHPMFIYGIEWLPISPVLDYLGFDPEFGKYQLDSMMKAQTESVPGFTFQKLGADWGNVALGYRQTYDPDGTAEQLDELYDVSDPIAREHGTGGITYYLTHAHRSLGQWKTDFHTDLPTSRIYFNQATNKYSAVVFNPATTAQTVIIYHGDDVAGTVNAPSRQLVALPFAPAK